MQIEPVLEEVWILHREQGNHQSAPRDVEACFSDQCLALSVENEDVLFSWKWAVDETMPKGGYSRQREQCGQKHEKYESKTC